MIIKNAEALPTSNEKFPHREMESLQHQMWSFQIAVVMFSRSLCWNALVIMSVLILIWFAILIYILPIYSLAWADSVLYFAEIEKLKVKLDLIGYYG